ncbi:MAG TPA: hypothetical protein VIH88_02355 [Candidatus Acidoferrales bacterium]
MLKIGESIPAKQNYKLSVSGREALERHIAARKLLPHFSNARSIRNALDRARLRQTNRNVLSAGGGQFPAE